MIKKIIYGFFTVLALGLALGLAALLLWPESSYQPYEVDAAYQAQVDQYYIPPMPGDWTWKTAQMPDGTQLRFGETGNKNAARATIIWVPGYTATLDMYGEHFDMLAREGLHIVGVDLRGQGGSDRHRYDQPEKLWIDDFGVYSDDLAILITSLDLPENRILIVAGSSFGGHVAIRTMGDHDVPVDGLFLFAPAIKPESKPYSFEDASRLMNISRMLGKSRHYVFGQGNWVPDGTDFSVGSRCSSHPERLYYRDVIFTRQPEQRVGGVTNQWGAEFFESSNYMLSPGYLEAIDIPVTIISAEIDDFVVTEINSEVCRSTIPQCREVAIPGTGHCLLQENDAVLSQIFEEINALVEKVSLSMKP